MSATPLYRSLAGACALHAAAGAALLTAAPVPRLLPTRLGAPIAVGLHSPPAPATAPASADPAPAPAPSPPAAAHHAPSPRPLPLAVATTAAPTLAPAPSTPDPALARPGADAPSTPAKGVTPRDSASASAALPAASAGAGAAISGDASSAAILEAIRARIRTRRRYPELARRRGIEGTVGLSFRVAADGSVSVDVVRGADPVLDAAAREAVLASAPLPPIAGALSIDLDFRLSED